MKRFECLCTVLAAFVLTFWNSSFSQSESTQAGGTLEYSSTSSSINKDFRVSTTVDTAIAKYPGFIGSYIYYPGTVYAGWGSKYNDSIQVACPFGVYGAVNGAKVDVFPFGEMITRLCTVYGAEQVYGVIFIAGEHGGVVNNPRDTALYNPDPSAPGMIQGAHRFSRLSKIYPQIVGIILDDFYGVTNAQLYQIREALRGKSLDSNGVVVDSSPETTPDLKLYICYYQSGASGYPASIDTLIDGVNLWVDNNQDVNYVNLDNYIDAVRQKYPGTSILTGADLTKNPAGILGLIQTSDSLYEQGQINGMMLFQESYLERQYITLARWDSLAIPAFLDTSYYPYLGSAMGKVVDASGNPVSRAMVTVERIVNGDTIIVARKYTDGHGQYNFSGWAGRYSPTKYKVVVEDSAHVRSSLNVELQGQKDTTLQITVQSVTGVSNGGIAAPTNYNLEQNYPNPFNPVTTIKYELAKPGDVILKVYDILGRQVANLSGGYELAGSYSVSFDGSRLASGVYFYRISTGNYTSVRKMMLLK